MTEQELIKNYPILDDSSFKLVKASILNLLSKDDLADDRAFLVEYCDSSADADDDVYFWEMLQCVKFINERDAVAYTTPDKIISLSYPSEEMVPMDNERFQRWYFIYCHECLHQLWGTFDVEAEIKKLQGDCNHDVLNVASDCVINDFLDVINKKHKKRPVGGIFPDVIKDKWGIEYNRKIDTQFTLYNKIMGLGKDKLNDLIDQFGGQKIKPASVTKQDTDGGGGGLPPEKHSPDYIKGWTDGINDVLAKKVDPKTYTPKTGDDDYTKGYNDVLAKIKEGVEKGVTMSSSKSAGGGSQGDLPQIPWEQDPDKQSGGGAGGSGSSQDNSDKAQDAADKAQEAADKAQKAANNNDAKGASDATQDAADAAQQAADAAQKAADAANKAAAQATAEGDSDKAKEAQDAAAKAEQAADAAQQAADAAKKAAKDGDAQAAADAAQDAADAAKDAASATKEASSASGDSNGQDEGSPKGQAGKNAGNIDTRKFEEEASRHAEAVIKKYANQLSGVLGQFVEKCKISKAVKPDGLAINSTKGKTQWNKELTVICKQYVKQKLQSKRKYENTYTKVRRGERAFTTADLRSGKRVIVQGRREVRQQIGFDINLYIDVSGSMGSCISSVFKTAYSVVDALKIDFGKEKMVDKSKIKPRTFVFTTRMREIKYGTKCLADGGTYSFTKLMKDISDAGEYAFLNIIITDGRFDSFSEKDAANVMKDMEGMFVLITNNPEGTFDTLEKEVKHTAGNKLKVLYADEQFTIDNK